ncbi:hypothetical protein L596_021990 [Steinernema carpocapsae]|uniref:Uncharacterized protein n=1 Tax=Steinernema carpocapsae TaxID=34508 RepID=A0A4U5MKD4_STECR|nr:hypothetical protein L596_021990 [Steinernema carpocapsae]
MTFSGSNEPVSIIFKSRYLKQSLSIEPVKLTTNTSVTEASESRTFLSVPRCTTRSTKICATWEKPYIGRHLMLLDVFQKRRSSRRNNFRKLP